ncbi:MAG: hypothetical protein HZC02_04315 [Candidatus Levybacteria bacterium]|nr:hypothetical protein [Candidatus Levybacteria bacterium]
MELDVEIVTSERPIAVAAEEAAKFGCPYCGYRSGSSFISGGGTTAWRCGDQNCGRVSALLADGVTVSAIGFGDYYPTLVAHPRLGTPSHGSPDERPENGGEFFSSRGIGLDGVPCFICATIFRDEEMHRYLHNIAAFVRTKAAGDRVVAMFKQGAVVDYREYEPDRVQVKIGACDTHKPNLELLDQLVRKNGHVITDDIVQRASAKIPN